MNPLVGVDRDGGPQDDWLGAEVVSHLYEAIHYGEGNVVRSLQPLPAPQDQPLRGFCFDAQFKVVRLQGFLAARGEGGRGEDRAELKTWLQKARGSQPAPGSSLLPSQPPTEDNLGPTFGVRPRTGSQSLPAASAGSQPLRYPRAAQNACHVAVRSRWKALNQATGIKETAGPLEFSIPAPAPSGTSASAGCGQLSLGTPRMELLHLPANLSRGYSFSGDEVFSPTSSLNLQGRSLGLLPLASAPHGARGSDTSTPAGCGTGVLVLPPHMQALKEELCYAGWGTAPGWPSSGQQKGFPHGAAFDSGEVRIKRTLLARLGGLWAAKLGSTPFHHPAGGRPRCKQSWGAWGPLLPMPSPHSHQPRRHWLYTAAYA